MKYALLTLGAAAALAFAGSGASAQGIGDPDSDVFVVADSYGTGFIVFAGGGGGFLDSFIAPDPGPGGNSAALTYDLGGPPSIVTGDVLLVDPTGTYYPGLIRFNPGDADSSATFVFYSLENGPLSGPTAGYPTFTVAFDGPGGLADYLPGVNDPGYIEGFQVEYLFLSPSAVPEPSALAALGFGVLGIATLVIKSRRRRPLVF
ncbi:MAG: PEP-CTERM sorting domain-containing protein [Capsulimonas sp.]|uniref:PEP-CTERM sorting domain-containing protein n=1 Tax=Capsulimonas sp. TaxID=2494211 RepID=UPI00326364C2